MQNPNYNIIIKSYTIGKEEKKEEEKKLNRNE